jgi:hypothetical protein
VIAPVGINVFVSGVAEECPDHNLQGHLPISGVYVYLSFPADGIPDSSYLLPSFMTY